MAVENRNCFVPSPTRDFRGTTPDQISESGVSRQLDADSQRRISLAARNGQPGEAQPRIGASRPGLKPKC